MLDFMQQEYRSFAVTLNMNTASSALEAAATG
jgi:hypothetical protein